jgi:ankyrin repeat protein
VFTASPRIAAQNGHAAIVKWLLEETAVSVDAPDKHGQTPLFVACQNGHIDIAKLLVAHRANVNHTRADGPTPLHCACWGGHVAVVQWLLLEAGAQLGSGDVAQAKPTPLMLACERGHAYLVRFLIEQQPDLVKQRLTNGTTAVWIACKAGALDIVQFLCEQGADPHALGEDDTTTVFAATVGGHLNVVKYLVEVQGVDSKRPSARGVSAIGLAAEKSHPDIARFLLCSHIQSGKLSSTLNASLAGRSVLNVSSSMLRVRLPPRPTHKRVTAL